MCSNVCVSLYVCVCPFSHCCLLSRSQASERKHITSSGSEICFVSESKLQCLCSSAVTPCAFAHLQVCALLRAHTCQGVSMCLIVSVWVVVVCVYVCVIVMGVWFLWSRQQHGGTDYLSALPWQKSALRLTNLTSRFNIPLISLSNTGLLEVVNMMLNSLAISVL